MLDVAGDSDEFDARGAGQTCVVVPLAAFAEYGDGMAEGLDVIERGGLAPDARVHGARRLVAGLRPIALDGFHECRLFAADVAAGGDEDFKVEVDTRAQNVLA